jgi:DNA-binding transcriptional ArsR family regulator
LEQRGRKSRVNASVSTEVSGLAIGVRCARFQGMIGTVEMAEIAALVGDPGRANMLSALMDGRALTATELAFAARVSPQTASGHLAKLTAAQLLIITTRGRYRYYRIATPLVGRMLEGILAVAGAAPARYRPASKADEALRTARTCYDHLAGRLGVGLADTLSARGYVVMADEAGEITPEGLTFFASFGIEAPDPRRRRAYCRPCLDWSERRPHLAGAIGAALARRCFNLGWLERGRNTRALTITTVGRRGLSDLFDLTI